MTAFEQWWHTNRSTFTTTGTKDEDIAEEAWTAAINAFADRIVKEMENYKGKATYHLDLTLKGMAEELRKELLK